MWHSPLHASLRTFVASTQANVTGEVRLRFFKGSCTVVGPAVAARAVRPVARDVRGGGRPLRPPAGRGVHPAVVAAGPDLGGEAGDSAAGGRDPDANAPPRPAVRSPAGVRRNGTAPRRRRPPWRTQHGARARAEPRSEPRGRSGPGGSRAACRTRRSRSRGRSDSTGGWRRTTCGRRRHTPTRCTRPACSTRTTTPRSPTSSAGWRPRFADGTFPFDPADEDVHSAIERVLTERLGDAGARIHAGRSRNDLVVTDLRMWTRDACDADRRRYRRAGVRAGRPGRGRTSARRCPASPTSSGRSPFSSPTTSWRTRSPSRATPAGSAAARTSSDVCALGAGALAGSTLDLPT